MVLLALDISTLAPVHLKSSTSVCSDAGRGPGSYPVLTADGLMKMKGNPFGLCSGSYHVLHLEVLDQVEVDEHADGGQRGFRVGQLKVAEAEVQKPQ